MKNLQGKSVIILAHVLTTVPAEDLKTYFIMHKARRLLFIALPLFFDRSRPGPYYEMYEEGEIVRKIQMKNRKLPGVIQYMRDFFLASYWIMKTGRAWDVIICLDNLNTMTGLCMRLLGRVTKVIYYTIDFVPKRFSNQFLDSVYHRIDKFAIIHANASWHLTKRMIEARQKFLHIDMEKLSNQVIVPIGSWIKTIPHRNIDSKSHKIVYAGGLLPHQGVQLILEALPLVIKKIPDVSFTIMGIGSYENDLKNKTKKLHLQNHVTFLGYMETHRDVEISLAKGDLAMAMYAKELDIWSYYADPSKIKTYLAIGLPIITTDVTYIATELEKAQCGKIVAYDKEQLAYAIIDMFSHPAKQKIYSKNALAFSHQFDWEKIFTKGLSYV